MEHKNLHFFLRIYIFNKLPDSADAAGCGQITFE
jgi:hypothetical protein